MQVNPTESPPVYTVEYEGVSAINVPPPSYDAATANDPTMYNRPPSSAANGQSTSKSSARPKSKGKNKTSSRHNQPRTNQPATSNQNRSNANRSNQTNQNATRKSFFDQLRHSPGTTRYILITAAIFVLWDITGIIFASIYWNECNIVEFLYIFPLAFGLVGGIFHVTTGVETYVFDVKKKKQKKKPPVWAFIQPVLGLASFVLLLHGCIHVYSTATRSGDDARVSEPSTSENYCHPALFYFVFSMCTFILCYIGVTIILLCTSAWLQWVCGKD